MRMGRDVTDLDEIDGTGLAQLEVDPERTIRVFDSHLLREPVSVLRVRTPLVYGEGDSVGQATRDMQRRHRGCVLITEDGTSRSRLAGIFTERDILIRVMQHSEPIDSLKLGELMTRDPETLPLEATVAWVLNKMSVGGFRHVPVVDGSGLPAFVISVKDAVQYLVDAFPTEILNLPPEFGLASYRAREGA
jgi:CBS domain-containing protein